MQRFGRLKTDVTQITKKLNIKLHDMKSSLDGIIPVTKMNTKRIRGSIDIELFGF